jgi:hypothetical protein
MFEEVVAGVTVVGRPHGRLRGRERRDEKNGTAG